MNAEIVDKLVLAMEEADLDATIAMSPENFAYVTGFVVPSQPVLRWRHAAAVVTRDARVALYAVDMEASTVRDLEPEADIRIWQEFEGNAMPVFADLIRDLGLTGSRIGVETEYIPARDLEQLRTLIPDVRWEPAGRLFDRLRMIKTPREVEHMRTLSRITDGAIADAFASVSAGSTEMDLAGAVTSALFRRGAQNFKLLIVASGPRSQYPNVGPTHRALERGDLVRLEVFGVLDGYHAGVCRTAVVQEPSHEALRIWENFVRCRDLLAEIIRPGASSGAIYRRFLETFGELGYDPISFVGHGIGLFLHEEPYLGRFGEWVLQAGMVLGVEPVVLADGFGLQLKDVVTVTNEGCERLSDVTKTDDLVMVG
ncbi:MAG TPA: Xaa-Pro peptidase family protein [Actinomycetota bacterium]|jgi:Xaa-Pro aminopeptidase|nr:Xaa-Pro peptidase family protein [Actinomycetota bacterium]